MQSSNGSHFISHSLTPSSGTSVKAIAFDQGAETQGSELTVEDPKTDEVYTCRVTQNGIDADTADTSVILNVYGEYLYSSNRSSLGSRDRSHHKY